MRFIEMPEKDAEDVASKLDEGLESVTREQVGGGIHVPPEQRVKLSYVTKLPTETKGVVRVPVHEKIEALAMDSLAEKLDESAREALFEKLALSVEVVEEKIERQVFEEVKEESPITLEEAK